MLVPALAFSTLLAVAQAATTCTFSDAISLGRQGNVELQQYMNVEENTFTIKMTYTGGQAFIGIGLQDSGTNHMTPANAVIGQADSGVAQYRLTSEKVAGVNLASSQTLIDSSFVQTDSTSTLTFTQSLDDITDRDLTQSSIWIWAVGFNGNYFTGHSQDGSVTFALTDGCVTTAVETDAPTDASTDTTDDTPTAMPTDAPTSTPIADLLSEPIELGSEGNVQLQQYLNVADNTFTIKVTYTGGQSFIGIGLNDEEGSDHMDPATAVIGRVDAGVALYRLTDDSLDGVNVASSQTLRSARFGQSDTKSTLTFTQSLSDISDRDLTQPSVWIWAIGFDDNAFTGHSQWGSVKFALTSNQTNVVEDDDEDDDENDDENAPTASPVSGNESASPNYTGSFATLFAVFVLPVWCGIV